jgi:peptidoglycan/LPS O-acetylase OafA/YrhL
MLHHCNQHFGLTEGSFLWQVGDYGHMGVNMFFIISGFIIPFSMSKYNYAYGDFKEFMLKRVTRIEPPYIVSIIVALLLFYATTLSPWYNGEPFTINWAYTLGHLAYLNAFTGSPWINAAYWTLAIEFEFYLLMSLLFPLLIFAKRSIVWGTLLLLIASAWLPVPHSHIFHHMPFFALGICLFLYSTERMSLPVTLLFMAATGLVMAYFYQSYYLVLAVATLAAIQFINKVPRPLLFIGTISYSLYLIHGFVIGRFFGLVHRFLPGLNPVVANLLCIACIFACSYIFYLLVEKPFQLLSKKMGARRNAAAGKLKMAVAIATTGRKEQVSKHERVEE